MKMMKAILAVITALLGIAIMAGCSTNKNLSTQTEVNKVNDSSSEAVMVLSGTYYATELNSEGTLFSDDILGFSLDSFSVEFKEDGTLTLYLLGSGITGTYSGTGSTATVTLQDEGESDEDSDDMDTTVLTLDGDKIILGDSQSGTMTFEKK